MNIYEKTVQIDTTLQELFNFHTDTNNLIRITPLNIKAELLTKNVEIKKDAILKIKTIKNFLPMTWVVKIEDINEPNLLVDTALSSPFAYWRHSHIFYEENGKVFMKDKVEYKLPFGFIGKLFIPLVKKELEDMFSFRHNITKEYLENRG